MWVAYHLKLSWGLILKGPITLKQHSMTSVGLRYFYLSGTFIPDLRVYPNSGWLSYLIPEAFRGLERTVHILLRMFCYINTYFSNTYHILRTCFTYFTYNEPPLYLHCTPIVCTLTIGKYWAMRQKDWDVDEWIRRFFLQYCLSSKSHVEVKLTLLSRPKKARLKITDKSNFFAQLHSFWKGLNPLHIFLPKPYSF